MVRAFVAAHKAYILLSDVLDFFFGPRAPQLRSQYCKVRPNHDVSPLLDKADPICLAYSLSLIRMSLIGTSSKR